MKYLQAVPVTSPVAVTATTAVTDVVVSGISSINWPIFSAALVVALIIAGVVAWRVKKNPTVQSKE